MQGCLNCGQNGPSDESTFFYLQNLQLILTRVNSNILM